MTNKPKQQGTRFETWLVNRFDDCYLLAQRLAEAGLNDRGDIEVQGTFTFIIEAKARERLNVHQALARAQEKAGPDQAVVVWRKLTKKDEGSKRRSPDGVKDVAIMELDTLIELLGGDVLWPKSSEPRK